MALEIRSIPVLEGRTAERFVREAEENARNPKKMKRRFTTEQIEEMMKRGVELRKRLDRGEIQLG
ncbi:MAG: hypothetical protein HUJ98_01725 [Bacteroidaceae bacterium]|nr:hypothetical protein [Bacteroidaceae bacterium]